MSQSSPGSSWDNLRYDTGLAGMSPSTIKFLFNKYTEHLLPFTTSFMDKTWLIDRFVSSEHLLNPQGAYATMLLSICALSLAVINKVLQSGDLQDQETRQQAIFHDALIRHYGEPMGQSPDIERIVTTIHLALYLAVAGRPHDHHHKIVEALCLSRYRGLHRPDGYEGMSEAERLRSLAIYQYIVVTDRCAISVTSVRQGLTSVRVYELRDGTGLVASMERQLLLPSDESPRGVDACKDAWRHISQLLRIFDIVTDGFCCCSGGHCILESCSLSGSDVIDMVSKLDRAVGPVQYQELRSLGLSTVEEARWIEYPICQQWISATIWQMAERHHIDTDQLPPERFSLWPLNMVKAAARILSVADPRALLIQGNGTVSG